MRTTALALAGILTAASAAATDSSIGFRGPAQLYGPTFSSNDTWAFVSSSSDSSGENTAIRYEDLHYDLRGRLPLCCR